MNSQAAVQEAQRRWGDAGSVRQIKKQHLVGFIALGMFFEVKGQGSTWAAAFDDADRRQVKAEEFYAEIDRERAEAK